MVRFEERPLPYMISGSAYYQKKDYMKAGSILEKGLLFTDNEALKFEFYVLLAEVYNNLQLFGEAEKYFDLALALDGDNPAVNNNYAYFLAVQEKRFKEALKMSELSLKSDPESSVYLDTYGWILFKLKKDKKALKFLEEALRKGGSENAEILDHYGDILFRSGNEKQAVESWNRAIEFSDEELTYRIREKLKLAGGLTESL
jgi:Tfp pilus assembly protein PilF